jgi:hypothetical protein
MRLKTLLLLALIQACSKPEAEREQEHEEPKKSATPLNRVQLSAEALKRAAINVGKVERRAMSSGAAIAAEVQFDPTSTAHVGPLAPMPSCASCS